MKKTSKRILAFILAAIMLFSISAVTGMALVFTKKTQYTSYLALGDSIPGGFSLPAYKDLGKFCVNKVRVDGSYPDLIAKDLGLDEGNDGNVKVLCQPGFRTTEFRVLLESNYTGDYVTEKYIGEFSGNSEYNLQALINQRDEYATAIKNADIITLDLGFNDTWLPFIGAVYEIMDQWGEDNMQNILNMPKFAKLIADSIVKMTAGYYINYDHLVKAIYKLNPNATIVSVGCYNPFRMWTLPDGNGLYIGDLLDPLYKKMNLWKYHYENLYNTRKQTKYMYVDVPETECITESIMPLLTNPTRMLQEDGWDPHPTVAGHDYIASQIAKKLGITHKTSNVLLEQQATEAAKVAETATAEANGETINA